MNETKQQASRLIREQAEVLAAAVVTRQYALQPEIWRPYGDSGRDKSVRDVGYHLSYLAEALLAGDPALFVDYCSWVGTLFDGLSFPKEVLPTTLTCLRDELEARLPGAAAAVTGDYVEAGLRRITRPDLPAAPPSYVDPQAALGPLARQYLDALLRAERQEAARLILEAADGDVPVRDIYLRVFQPVQYEIGRLWQTNQLSVAQEHYCTAATQLIMSQLYPRIFAGEKIGRSLVATSVGGELHEIGIRMVADFFEMEGWDTYYVGANAPAGSIVHTLAERRADVLAVSATMTFHVRSAAELIARARASTEDAAPKILVGGYPFNVATQLWRQVGADGYAPDAQQAVDLARRLVEERGA